MKNTIKLLEVIACVVIIGFSMAACAQEESIAPDYDPHYSGPGLTITNIPHDRENHTIYGKGKMGDVELYAAESVTFTGGTPNITRTRINYTDMTLKVWEVYEDYSGNLQVRRFQGSGTASFSLYLNGGSERSRTISFSVGSASVAFNSVW